MDFATINNRLNRLLNAHYAAQAKWHDARTDASASALHFFDVAWQARFPGVPYEASTICSDKVVLILRNVGADKTELLEDKRWGVFDFDPADEYSTGVPLPEGSEGPVPAEHVFELVAQLEAEHPGLRIDVRQLEVRVGVSVLSPPT